MKSNAKHSAKKHAASSSIKRAKKREIQPVKAGLLKKAWRKLGSNFEYARFFLKTPEKLEGAARIKSMC